MTTIQPNLQKEPLRFRLKAFFRKPANLILLLFLVALTALSLVPAMGLGLFAGVKSAGKLSEKTVRRCTAVVLMVCGALLAAGNM